jgi:DNA polymerase III delta prime subunit
MLLVDKYKPKESKFVLGGEYVCRELAKWLKAWNKDKKLPRAFMISGPPGIGKSTLVDLVLAENGIPNALKLDSTAKNPKKAFDKVKEAFGTRKVDAYFTGKMQRSKPGAVIIDDLDAMISTTLSQIVRFVGKTKVPVVCITNDPNAKAIQALKAKCHHVRMNRPQEDAIFARLTFICQQERSKRATIPQPGQLRSIARSSGGDVRQAMNELQFCLSGNGSVFCSVAEGTGLIVDRPLNAFEAATALFAPWGKLPATSTSQPTSKGASALSGTLAKQPPSELRATKLLQLASRAMDADSHLVPLMIQENYLKACTLENMAEAAEAISLGDVMSATARKMPGNAPEMQAFFEVAYPAFRIGAKLQNAQERIEFPEYPAKIGEINRRAKGVSELAAAMYVLFFAFCS